MHDMGREDAAHHGHGLGTRRHDGGTGRDAAGGNMFCNFNCLCTLDSSISVTVTRES